MSYMKASLMERSFEVGLHQTATAIALADRVIGERNQLIAALRQIADLPADEVQDAPTIAAFVLKFYGRE